MPRDVGEPAPEEDVWWAGLRWVEAAFMQAHRFEDVVHEMAGARADALMRAQLNAATESAADWRASHDQVQAHDDQRPVRVPTYALAMQESTELDLLLVAVRNVLRAQRRLPEHLRTSMADQKAVTLLRNIAEHWDEVGGSSATTLATEHPYVSATTFSYTSKEILLGNAIPLSRVIAWLGRVRQALLAALAANSIAVPDDDASIVTGDDELPWPEQRLRNRYWTLPIVEREHWPTRELPDDVAMALARLFRSRRQRDTAD